MYTLLVWIGIGFLPKAWFGTLEACQRLSAAVMDSMCRAGTIHQFIPK